MQREQHPFAPVPSYDTVRLLFINLCGLNDKHYGRHISLIRNNPELTNVIESMRRISTALGDICGLRHELRLRHDNLQQTDSLMSSALDQLVELLMRAPLGQQIPRPFWLLLPEASRPPLGPRPITSDNDEVPVLQPLSPPHGHRRSPRASTRAATEASNQNARSC